MLLNIVPHIIYTTASLSWHIHFPFLAVSILEMRQALYCPYLSLFSCTLLCWAGVLFCTEVSVSYLTTVWSWVIQQQHNLESSDKDKSRRKNDSWKTILNTIWKEHTLNHQLSYLIQLLVVEQSIPCYPSNKLQAMQLISLDSFLIL